MDIICFEMKFIEGNCRKKRGQEVTLKRITWVQKCNASLSQVYSPYSLSSSDPVLLEN